MASVKGNDPTYLRSVAKGSALTLLSLPHKRMMFTIHRWVAFGLEGLMFSVKLNRKTYVVMRLCNPLLLRLEASDF